MSEKQESFVQNIQLLGFYERATDAACEVTSCSCPCHVMGLICTACVNVDCQCFRLVKKAEYRE